MELRHYVAGFALSDRGTVLLIQKLKPEWQRGKLNGVGGSIEPGETPAEAMVREFSEETGLVTEPSYWAHFATVTTPVSKVWFFAADLDIEHAKTTTAETVFEVPLDTDWDRMTPNLRWLLPLATRARDLAAPVEVHNVTEEG